MIIETTNGNLFEMEFQHNIISKQKGEIGVKETRSKLPVNEHSSTTVKLFEVSDYGKIPSKKTFVDFAEAYCSSKDNFSKSFGRKMAIKKLLRKIDMRKEDRVVVWEQYFADHKY